MLTLINNCLIIQELDWIGPIDNRPSTDKLDHFVGKKKKKKEKEVTCDTGHVPYNT